MCIIKKYCIFATRLLIKDAIIMKGVSLALILACCTLALAAQDVIKVNYKGAKPTISDFAWAFLTASDDEECGSEPVTAFKTAWVAEKSGKPQEDGVLLTIDEKNGFVRYEYRYDDVVTRMEMCYWNESDGKHKLFAFNNMASLAEGKPVVTETSGLNFWRYDNATKQMTYINPPGFEVEYINTTYALPWEGKNIGVTKWDDDGPTEQLELKWNGRRFSF